MEREYKISRKNYFWKYVCAILFCWTIIVPLIIIISAEIKVRGTKYIIDDENVIYKYKFLKVQEKKISKKDITDISLTQNLTQRYFNIGKLYINTAGSVGMEMVWEGIETPDKVRELIK